MPKVNPVLYMARLRALAAERGGTVLSKRYLGDQGKLEFRCARSHVFTTSPGGVVGGHWCSRCSAEDRAARTRAEGLAKLAAVVARKGGTLDPAEYVSSQVAMGFRCAHGHTWRTIPTVIIHRSWCPRCAGAERGRARSALVAKRIAALVQRRGGVLLAPGFTVYKSELRIRCREGHRFEITPESLEAGLWCTHCRQRAMLDRLRAAAARWQGVLRSKSYVRANDKLDWRCAQGHEFSKSAVAVFAGGWCRLCRSPVVRGLRDLQRIARARAGECLSPRLPARGQKARWRCQFGHEWTSLPTVVVNGHWCPECGRFSSHDRHRLTIEKLRQTAIERGGRCLSKKYVNSDDKLRWECAQGHRWTGRVGNIRQGSRCPRCAHRVRGSIESLHALATERGGRCVTRHWDDHAQPVEFVCAKGHRFHLSGPAIRTGVWCPKCSRAGGTASGRALRTRRRP